MSQNKQNSDEIRRRRAEEVRAKFTKIAAEMPYMRSAWDNFDQGEITEADHEKCSCPGCRFRRMVARYRNPPMQTREESQNQVFPTTNEIEEEMFSELLATLGRIRKSDAPIFIRKMTLVSLQDAIRTSLEELKAQAENIDENLEKQFQSLKNRPAGNRSFITALSATNRPSPSPPERFRNHLKVGSLARLSMVGRVESIDGDSVLMRYELPGMSRGVS